MSTFSEIVKKYQTIIVWVLLGITGASLTLIFDGVDRIRGIMEAEQEIVRLENKVDSLHAVIHFNNDVTEMDWEFARSITDNMDGDTLYEIVSDNGIPYQVDIRENAEGDQFAFIFRMFIIYPIHFGPNGRMYVMLHHSTEQNTYLRKIQ